MKKVYQRGRQVAVRSHALKEWEPRPDTILLDGKPLKHKGSGTFYLDWRENGKRIQSSRGKRVREALDAWCSKVLAEARPDALAEEGRLASF